MPSLFFFLLQVHRFPKGRQKAPIKGSEAATRVLGEKKPCGAKKHAKRTRKTWDWSFLGEAESFCGRRGIIGKVAIFPEPNLTRRWILFNSQFDWAPLTRKLVTITGLLKKSRGKIRKGFRNCKTAMLELFVFISSDLIRRLQSDEFVDAFERLDVASNLRSFEKCICKTILVYI